jgi:DNA polymerase-3 subunit epsilon
VDNSRRDLHGALLDARILADVYLAMSGGQAALSLHNEPTAGPAREASRRMARGDLCIPVIEASAAELADHEKLLESIEATTGEQALFRAARRR